ncbi:MAG: prepilin-type N-terminal cleavage/methylation domain-containing protein [Phycisphaerales bacterium]|nr:prepilin-type N-terminal cleavage/methylation domain-containing protein [Phycisphaerales bacterium]
MAYALQKNQERGFTIIELVVVISIVVVLLALLIPGLGAVRKSARAAACQSNLRTTYTGFRTYQDANNNALPIVFGGYRPGDGQMEPVRTLAEMLGVPAPERSGDEFTRRQPWACPEDTTVFREKGWSYYEDAYLIYGYYRTMGGNPMGRTIAHYENDPESIFVVEASQPAHGLRDTRDPLGRPQYRRHELLYDGTVRLQETRR